MSNDNGEEMMGIGVGKESGVDGLDIVRVQIVIEGGGEGSL